MLLDGRPSGRGYREPMGLEDRDWYRVDGRRRARRRLPWTLLFAVAALAAVVAALRLDVLSESHGWEVGAGPLAGPALAVAGEPLYANGDPWLAYLADERTCPGGEDGSRPLRAQVETMLCLIDFARTQAHVPLLNVSALLSSSARLKGEGIVRCGAFAHSPCGEDPDAGVRDLGYDGSFGENLYVGDGRFGAPRVALDRWLNSPGHRENLLRPEWRAHSLYAVKLERFREYRGATLWVSHFGDRL
jgi:hypothetical protein